MRTSYFNFLWQQSLNFRHYLFNNLISDFSFLSSKVFKVFHMINIKRGMASSIKLIINFKNPGCYIQIMSNQLCKTHYKFLFIIDVKRAYWGRHISLLENSFWPTLWRIQIWLLWFWTNDWNCKCDWKFDFIDWWRSWDNVSLFSFNDWFDSFQWLRRIE